MKFKIITTIIFINLYAGIAYAQQNVDSVFAIAIEKSRADKFDEAIQEAQKALKMDSLRGDIMVFAANVYSWKQHNDSAMIYLDNARKLNYLNDEFYESSLNVLLRAQKNDSLLVLCDEAEKNGYKNSKDLVKKRAIVYDNTMEYYKIYKQFKDSTAKSMLDDVQLADIYERAKKELTEQIVAADYSIDIFSTGELQHYAGVSYTNKFNNLSTTIGFNYANRFGLNDLQFDYTGYKKLRSKNYWYMNYAYAFNGNLFAKHRIGLEYFFKTKNETETSLGARYLFYPLAIDKDIWIATGSIGFYIKNSWLSVRPYFVIRENQTSLSFSAKYRIYKENILEYTSFELGFGNSPDDIYTSTSGSFNQLMSYRFRAEKSKVINKKSQLVLAAAIMQEQYTIGTDISSRFRFIFDVGYRFRF
ncbi:MAG: YaiO family outer membrane beta-barrel protein [Paludibacter sp.]|nr:YaiO family outer membrane beta-barrel protein [Paludibacter sp.]